MRKNFFKHCKNYPSLAGKIAYIYRFDARSGGFIFIFVGQVRQRVRPFAYMS